MKIIRLTTALFALMIGVMTAGAAPRTVDRSATGPQPDMQHMRVKGHIEKIEGQRAQLVTSKGQHITVNLGPQKFWQDRGYHLDEGCDVTVDGWGDADDEDGGYMFAGGIYGDNFSFEMCDSRGFPMWADREDYEDEWCPQRERYEVYFFGMPWRWGPPPRWWMGPRWRWHQHWYRHHHAPPPPPWWGRGGHDRGWRDGGQGRGHDRPPRYEERPRHDRGQSPPDRPDNPPPERRDGRRAH